MSDLSIALQFVRQQCASDAAGGVHPGVAPPGTLTPYITVQFYGGADTLGVAGAKVLTKSSWLIEVWGPETQYSAIEAATSAVFAHLHQQAHVSVPDGVVLSCLRLQPRFNFEAVDGAQWLRQGGVYQIES